MALTSIVTSMYNATGRPLEALDRLYFPSLLNNASSDMQLILIDDGSPGKEDTGRLVDRYRGELEKRFGQFVYIDKEKNMGSPKHTTLA